MALKAADGKKAHKSVVEDPYLAIKCQRVREDAEQASRQGRYGTTEEGVPGQHESAGDLGPRVVQVALRGWMQVR